MAGISYGRLATPFVTTSGGSTTEFVLVPAAHEYIGTVRVAHVGSAGTGVTSYSLAHIASSGAATTAADYFAYNIDLYESDVHDYTIELAAGEALTVTPEDTFISFNFTGMDKDNS